MLSGNPETLVYRLMKDENWIMKHVGPCIQRHLSEGTLEQHILPLIQRAMEQGSNEKSLLSEIAKWTNDNLPTNNDVKKTIDCINNGVVHEAEENGLLVLKGLYSPVSCSLFSRFICITSKRIGYIS